MDFSVKRLNPTTHLPSMIGMSSALTNNLTIVDNTIPALTLQLDLTQILHLV